MITFYFISNSAMMTAIASTAFPDLLCFCKKIDLLTILKKKSCLFAKRSLVALKLNSDRIVKIQYENRGLKVLKMCNFPRFASQKNSIILKVSKKSNTLKVGLLLAHFLISNSLKTKN